jgi:uncharacterized protein YndB with AHSA1/START domain
MSAVRREIVLPAPPGQVWEAITSPEVLREWFGADVEWELTPGGSGQFHEEGGSTREARVDTVEPGRHLGFRWWPEGREDEASDVQYELSEDGDGTRLVVTETPAAPAGSPPAVSAMSPERSDSVLCTSGNQFRYQTAEQTADKTAAGTTAAWTDGDTRLFRVWAAAAAAAAAPVTARG